MSFTVDGHLHLEGEAYLEVTALIRGPHGRHAGCRFDVLVGDVVYATYPLRTNGAGRLRELLPFTPIDADAETVAFRLLLLR